MKMLRVLFISTALAASQAAFGQSCSGGPDGGMDATGNHCTTASATVAAPPAPERSAVTEPSVAKRAASGRSSIRGAAMGRGEAKRVARHS